MKKFLGVFVAIIMLSISLTSCVQVAKPSDGAQIDIVGSYDGTAVIEIYDDDTLSQQHEGNCVVGEIYYVAIEAQIQKTFGAVVDKVAGELSIEFPKTEDIFVTFNSGSTVTSVEGGDVISYNCKVYTDKSYTFVFAVTARQSGAFDVKVLIDEKLINSKILIF